MRRIYDAVSQTLGYRTLQQFSGADVWQLKVMLQALGFYAANDPPIDSRAAGATSFTPDVVVAVDAFRASDKLSGPSVGSPSGLVDPEMVSHLWAALERAGKARAIREKLLDVVAVRR
jgi:peptidoglycan hydrolase-like protein with peptidoglycan-binding domain